MNSRNVVALFPTRGVPVNVRGLISVVVLAAMGCSHATPRPLPEATRTQLGMVTVVSATFAPASELRTPAGGGAAGAGRGVMTGAAKGMAFGAGAASGCYGYGCLLAVALIPVGGLAGAIVGAIHGGVTAVPGAEVREAADSLRQATSDIDVQESLRDQVLRLTQERTCHFLAFDVASGPRLPKENITYQPLAAHGIGAVLELSVLELSLVGPWDVDPELAVALSVRAKLVRTSDGAILNERALDHRSFARRFTVWAADGARQFRDERDSALRRLAGQIVDEMFLIEPDGAAACSG